jgi:hypothetical protein
MVLVCNDPAAADILLSGWRPAPQPDLALRCSRMARAAPRERRNPGLEWDAQGEPG